MKQISLTKVEFQYCNSNSLLSSQQRDFFSKATIDSEVYLIEISEDAADEIRDLFGERLQIVGFDKNYCPTKEGEILESLIDKFFID